MVTELGSSFKAPQEIVRWVDSEIGGERERKGGREMEREKERNERRSERKGDRDR